METFQDFEEVTQDCLILGPTFIDLTEEDSEDEHQIITVDLTEEPEFDRPTPIHQGPADLDAVDRIQDDHPIPIPKSSTTQNSKNSENEPPRRNEIISQRTRSDRATKLKSLQLVKAYYTPRLSMKEAFSKMTEGGYKKSLEVKQSKIHGLGLFAKRSFMENEWIVEYAGEIISKAESDKREKAYISKGKTETMFFKLDRFLILDPTNETENMARMVNHSCNPNSVSTKVSIEGRKMIILVAKKAVDAGEEVTIDFLFPVPRNKKYQVQCNCKSLNCRKFIDAPSAT